MMALTMIERIRIFIAVKREVLARGRQKGVFTFQTPEREKDAIDLVKNTDFVTKLATGNALLESEFEPDTELFDLLVEREKTQIAVEFLKIVQPEQ